MECIFCQIANKTGHSSIVYEDDICIAFLDIYPISQGHTLVIPKKHFVTLEDCDNETAKHLITVVKKLNVAIKKTTNCDGILNEVMNGEAAGQEIFHVHFHIVPRFENDGFDWTYPEGYHKKAESKEELDKVAEQIKNAAERGQL